MINPDIALVIDGKVVANNAEELHNMHDPIDHDISLDERKKQQKKSKKK